MEFNFKLIFTHLLLAGFLNNPIQAADSFFYDSAEEVEPTTPPRTPIEAQPYLPDHSEEELERTEIPFTPLEDQSYFPYDSEDEIESTTPPPSTDASLSNIDKGDKKVSKIIDIATPSKKKIRDTHVSKEETIQCLKKAIKDQNFKPNKQHFIDFLNSGSNDSDVKQTVKSSLEFILGLDIKEHYLGSFRLFLDILFEEVESKEEKHSNKVHNKFPHYRTITNLKSRIIEERKKATKTTKKTTSSKRKKNNGTTGVTRKRKIRKTSHGTETTPPSTSTAQPSMISPPRAPTQPIEPQSAGSWATPVQWEEISHQGAKQVTLPMTSPSYLGRQLQAVPSTQPRLPDFTEQQPIMRQILQHQPNSTGQEQSASLMKKHPLTLTSGQQIMPRNK